MRRGDEGSDDEEEEEERDDDDRRDDDRDRYEEEERDPREYVSPREVLRRVRERIALADERVTTDEDGGQKGVPFRHVILTNVSWLARLTKDCAHAHVHPTLSWDWTKQEAPVKTYSPAFTGKVARCIRDFFMAPSTQFCLFCLESEGNPARAVVPDGPVVPVTVEDEHQDIYDTLAEFVESQKNPIGLPEKLKRALTGGPSASPRWSLSWQIMRKVVPRKPDFREHHRTREGARSPLPPLRRSSRRSLCSGSLREFRRRRD